MSISSNVKEQRVCHIIVCHAIQGEKRQCMSRLDQAPYTTVITSATNIHRMHERHTSDRLRRTLSSPCGRGRSVFLVFEYVEHDVGRLLDVAGVRFTVAEVKCLLQQLLRAVTYLHSRWILHRDLKMSNILLTHRFAPGNLNDASLPWHASCWICLQGTKTSVSIRQLQLTSEVMPRCFRCCCWRRSSEVGSEGVTGCVSAGACSNSATSGWPATSR